MTHISNDQTTPTKLTFYLYDLSSSSVLKVVDGYKRVEYDLSDLKIEDHILPDRSVVYLPPSHRKYLPNHLLDNKNYLDYLEACSLIVPKKLLPREIDENDLIAHQFNSKEALALFKNGAEQGFVPAKINLGKAYFSGLSVPKDQKYGASLLSELDGPGAASVQFALANWHYSNKGIETDHTVIVGLIERAAELGLADAQFVLGTFYCQGEYVEKNYDKAFLMCEKAAIQGHVTAQVVLAKNYSRGVFIPQDNAKALFWYEQAANKGSSEALCDLASIYNEGKIVPQNNEKAFALLETAANQGSAAGQCRLAMMYFDGDYKSDPGMAFSLFQQSANQGYASAQYCLGECFESGFGVKMNIKSALEWFEKAADQGQEEAIEKLIEIYQNCSTITNKIDRKAIQFYHKASEKNNAAAQNVLGECYQKGSGVKKDLTKAFSFFESSASQGFAEAHYNLGICYQKGLGVDKNLELAVVNYNKAIERGYSEAKAALLTVQIELNDIEAAQKNAESQQVNLARIQQMFKEKFETIMLSINNQHIDYEELQVKWLDIKGDNLQIESWGKIQSLAAEVKAGKPFDIKLMGEIKQLADAFTESLTKAKADLEDTERRKLKIKERKEHQKALRASQKYDQVPVNVVNTFEPIQEETVSETSLIKAEHAKEAAEKEKKMLSAIKKREKRAKARASSKLKYEKEKEKVAKEKEKNKELKIKRLLNLHTEEELIAAGILPDKTIIEPVEAYGRIKSFEKTTREVYKGQRVLAENTQLVQDTIHEFAFSDDLSAFKKEHDYEILKKGLGGLVNIDHLRPWESNGCRIHSFRVVDGSADRVVFAWNKSKKKAYKVTYVNYHSK